MDPPRGASFTIGLRRPSNPQGQSVEPLNQLPTSPRVDFTRVRTWSGHCFEKHMVLRNDIPPPPDQTAAPLPHDLKGPPGLSSKQHASAALNVPSGGSHSSTVIDCVPPPLKVKHFVQVSSLLKPLVETELLSNKTLFPLDWLPPPDDAPPLSPRGRTGSSIV